MLDIQVDGEAEDHIFWDSVDVATTFADPAIEPDVEHLCIAVLMLEGVVKVIASANYDGLIERAVDVLTNDVPTLVVCVRSQDLQQPDLTARLFKFHGCAIKAREDEATYRPYLVGRQSQIHDWLARPENAGMVDRLVSILEAKPTLMIGYSTQDANIQAIFARASVRLGWTWPGARPSYVFAEDAIGQDQRGLLRNVYRGDYRPATRQPIEESALIRAYAKPLLIALWLYALSAKLQKLIDLAPRRLDADGQAALKAGVIALRNTVADAVGADLLEFTEALIRWCGRAASTFREGRLPTNADRYKPITDSAVQQMEGNAALDGSGMHQAAIVAGLLGKGASDKLWTLKAPNMADPKAGVAEVVSGTGSAAVFLAANSNVASQLQHAGLLNDRDQPILIHSLDIVARMARSPRGALGRTGAPTVREVSITKLLEDAVTVDDLVRRFRVEVSL